MAIHCRLCRCDSDKKEQRKSGTLEAGLSFPGMFKHFPESFIRYSVAKFSSYLITNGIDQINQLNSWKVKGKLLKFQEILFTTA